MGAANAAAMLRNNFKPSASEALSMHLVSRVVAHDNLLPSAQALAEQWVAASKQRAIPCAASQQEYAQVNALESQALASAFLSAPFFQAQQKFLAGKGKISAAAMFWALRVTRPLWGKLLKT
jgi:peroxisomal 3,2-trans-enoyl-CoA isomerase